MASLNAHFWWIMATKTPFGLWLVAIILFLAQKEGCYGRRQGSEILYSPPPQSTLFGLLMAASFVQIACLLWRTSDSPSIAVAVSILGLLLLLLFRPYTLRVDLERRTYRLASGWPPLQRGYSGRLDDVAWLKTVRATGTTSLLVVWKSTGSYWGEIPSVRLGYYYTTRQAEADAAETQAAWAIRVPFYIG